MSLNSIAIYPGTFDPVTCGHTDVCRRAMKMFDHVVIGVADNPQKKPFFTLDERIEMLNIVFQGEKSISVKPFSGLLIDFARECDSQIIIRGLRAISDFEFEVQLAGMNRSLAPEVETVFLTAAEQFAFVSSSLVREIARLNGDVSGFIHPEVHKRLTEKLAAI
ncbi:MAG: pantetheine-phosphate adenylyltransferase [Gammaproteobacteria bacterium]|nr:pantetheine-phosphate adenylyltransferase [Gammaproteobacteria bacterium]MBT4078626.1 pantetheine-phosphate adenylyltransferase [Gammaproteobacteria bacterium]MBT4195836.1 pantetheine-phosphate adenylyltransferase [Gammaproteobacteria bacterium]MBT4448944.1 pantetheine-phosphate adenylyltransferase [Gammaproteobacteria bacterium]MBT4861606.1 pantetheine-phosphate adenylyltransferase [Gammaproteobacteria bacterium]